MTEDELRAHRAAQDVVNTAAREAALDAAAAQLSDGDAIEIVSRRTAAGGNDRELRRYNLRLACAMRLCGSTQKEIAAELGVSTDHVGKLLREGQQLTQRHTLQMLETRALPLAVDNLIAGLEAGHEKYTLETLKGGGVLKAHSKHDGSFAGPPVAMQIIFGAPPDQPRRLPEGIAHGRPMTLDVPAEE